MPKISPSKYLVRAGWDDVPHLDEKTKVELIASTPPHLVAARSKGIPSLGAGAVYPIPLERVKVEPFVIPNYWPRAYGLDVGWNRTAAIWGAHDRTDDTIYLYAEHYMGEELPLVHSQAIKARGKWIPGTIDPASRGRTQLDGQKLLDVYRSHELELVIAKNAVEAGIYEVWERLSTGRLKIFSTLVNFMFEYDIYRRDEKGKIVKKFDHLMDAMRYLIVMFMQIAKTKPVEGAIFGGGGPSVIGDRTAGY